jgi:hypothetical protein
MINLIYLAHTDPRFIRQARFSILALMEYIPEFREDYRLIVFTDQAESFLDLGAVIEPLDKARIREFRGLNDFVHRMKIRALQEVMTTYTGHAVLLDSDNLTFKDPRQLFEKLVVGDSILNQIEERLDQPESPLGKKFRRFFKKHPVIPVGSEELKIPMDAVLWNAGVVGIPEGKKFMLDQVLALCDYIYSRYQKHIAEQISFNIILGMNTQIQAGEAWIYHWFGHGQAINRIIADLFDQMEGKSVEEQIAAVAAVKEAVLQAPLNPDKLKKKWYVKWLPSS